MTSSKRSQKNVPRISQTNKKASAMSSLKKKLNAGEPEIQNYVRALEAKNFKLQEQVGELQAENTTLNNRIRVLLKQIEEKGPSFSEVVELACKKKSKHH